MATQSQPYFVFNEDPQSLRGELNLILSSIQDRLDRMEGVRGSALIKGSLTMQDGAIKESRAVFLTSAATLDLRESKGNLVDIAGTTKIRQILLDDGEERTLRFNNFVTLVHDGVKFILPGLEDLTARANDHAIIRGYPDGVTRMISLLRGPVSPVGQLQRGVATSVNATLSFTASTRNLLVWIVGGGGGGGGADGAAGESAAGAGGSAGGYGVALIVSKDLPVAETFTLDAVIGTGGAGGVGNNAGAAGGTSTLSFGATTFLQATGGAGGAASGSGAGVGIIASSGAPGVASSPSGLGLLEGNSGSWGDNAIRLVATRAQPGFGGAASWGGGTVPGQVANANGVSAAAFGSGGGGALSQDNGGSRTGGAGRAGRISILAFS